MRIFVVIKHIGDRELAYSDDQPVRCLRSGELIGAGLDLLCSSAQVDRLADECSRQSRIWIGRSDLVSFATRKSRNSQGIGEPKPLINFRVHPQFGSAPEPHARIERGVRGLPALSATRQTVSAHIGRPESRIGLLDESHLAVKVDVVQIRRGWRLR